jgi:hypothetical protein
MSDKSKPAHKILHRDLTVTIWRNEGERAAWYSLTVSRRYKKNDDTWHDSGSIGEDDVLRVRQMLAEADAYIQNARRADRQAEREAA